MDLADFCFRRGIRESFGVWEEGIILVFLQLSTLGLRSRSGNTSLVWRMGVYGFVLGLLSLMVGVRSQKEKN